MQDFVEVTGIVLKAVPVLEMDKRITVLTKERGKISAFARGAKKPGSRFMAATNPFCYGTFRLYEGKTAYNLSEVRIAEYFENLREDFEGAFYGMYFCDVADYYTRENNDEKEMLKLLYVSLKALTKGAVPHELVQYIFEMKALVVNGEFPGYCRKKCCWRARYIRSNMSCRHLLKSFILLKYRTRFCSSWQSSAGSTGTGISGTGSKALLYWKIAG